MSFTVYENNRADSPREISVDEVLDKIEEMDFARGIRFERKFNLALVEFGSFDPRSAEYAAFESKAREKRKEKLKGEP